MMAFCTWIWESYSDLSDLSGIFPSFEMVVEEEKDPPDPCPEVTEVWDVVARGHSDDGHAGWTCVGCGNWFNGLNATKATAHVLLLGGFSITPCVSWRKIPSAKLEKLRMIYARAGEEKEKRARKRKAEEAALSANNSTAGAALTSQTKRTSASRNSESGPGGMPLSGGTPPLPSASQPSIIRAFGAASSSELSMAIADFIHAHGLSFMLSESPRLKLILRLARTAPSSYKPPRRQEVGGELLDLNYSQYKSRTLRKLKLDADIYGVQIMSDGATVKHIPLLNFLGASAVCPPVMLDIVDCRDQMTEGGKKDAR